MSGRRPRATTRAENVRASVQSQVLLRNEIRDRLTALNPLELFGILVEHHESSPLHQLYHEVRDRSLEDHGGNVVQLAKLLETIDDAGLVDASTREAGFVMGFECFRQLVLGEGWAPSISKDGAK
jgi:hypothetical protein